MENLESQKNKLDKFLREEVLRVEEKDSHIVMFFLGEEIKFKFEIKEGEQLEIIEDLKHLIKFEMMAPIKKKLALNLISSLEEHCNIKINADVKETLTSNSILSGYENNG